MGLDPGFRRDDGGAAQSYLAKPLEGVERQSSKERASAVHPRTVESTLPGGNGSSRQAMVPPMKKSIVLAVLLAARLGFAESAPAPAPPQASSTQDRAVGQKIPEFTATLLDVSSDPPATSELDSKKVDKLTAYIFVGTRCPATQAYIERFRTFEQTYAPKGVQTVYVYPNSDDLRETKIAFHRTVKLGGRLIDDEGGRVARLFKAERTSEIFLADKKGTIVFHGGMDDSRDSTKVQKRYLADAIDEVLASKPVTVSFSQVFA